MLNTKKTNKKEVRSRCVSGKTKLFLASALCLLTSYIFSQGTWTKKSDVGGTASRYAAISFSIGTKGYVGLGVSVSSFGPADFWEWDQATNVWTQKADFPGGYRLAPVGFSIGTKGYVGTGSDGGSVYYKDFWEWNQATDTWTQKAPFGGVPRDGAVGFAVSGKGYIGTGGDSTNMFQDFWEYNPGTDTWIQKANFGGGIRYAAAGFSIGTKGYIGTGFDAVGVKNDLWEWDQATGNWLQKANVGGPVRGAAVGFSIGTKGYIGTGTDASVINYYNDFWEYNPTTDVWTQKANFGGTARYSATGFSIGTKGYLGTGGDSSSVTWIQSDFWEYDPSGNGVNDIDLSDKISVYPNPSNGRISVQVLGLENAEVKSISVYNAEGERISPLVNQCVSRFTNLPIDLSSQSNGIYFLQIKTENGTATKKIIISR